MKLFGMVFPTPIAKSIEELRKKSDVLAYLNSKIEEEKKAKAKKLLEKIVGEKFNKDMPELTGEAKEILDKITNPVKSEKLELDPETKKLEYKMMGNTTTYLVEARRKELLKRIKKNIEEELEEVE